jgi:hypothetical protein
MSMATILVAFFLVDIACTDVMPSKTAVRKGSSLNINVKVANHGSDTEVFNVTAYANTTVIASQTITLTSGKPTILPLTWNTTGFAWGNYTISAYAWPVRGETDLTNNNCTDGSVLISKLGDLGSGAPVPKFFKFDGSCNSQDIPLFLQCYRGTAPSEAMYLGDLGSGKPVPKFFVYDGKCDSQDIPLFLQCYRGLSP